MKTKLFLVLVFALFANIATCQKKGDMYIVNKEGADKVFSVFDDDDETCNDDKKSAQVNTVIKIIKSLQLNNFEVVAVQSYKRASKPEEEVEFNNFYCVDAAVLATYCKPYVSPEPNVFRELIYYRVNNMLVSAGVLHPNVDGLSNKESKAETRMKQKIRDKYIPPPYYLDENISLVIRNQNPAYLGSTVFDDTFKDPTNDLPKISILDNYKQVLVRNPDASNFRLFYSLTDLTNLSLDMDLSGGVADVLVGKISTAAKEQESNKRSISVSAGIFENTLASVYTRIISTFIDDSDWSPAFDLWELYKSEIIPSANKLKIIESFEGVTVSEKNDSEFNSKIDFSSNLSGNYSVIPFFKVSGDASANWTKETKTNANFSKYDIYIKGTPRLRRIPTPQEIRVAWAKKTSNIRTNYDLKITPNNTTNVIELEFGPVTTAEQLRFITPMTDNFITLFADNEKIIKEVQVQEIKYSNNRAYIPIAFTYNEAFFVANVNGASISTSKNLKVKFGSTVDNTDLDKTYVINFSANGTIIPAMDDGQPLYPEAVVTGSIHEWKFDIHFDNVNEALQNVDILKGDLLIDDRLKFLLDPPYFKAASCVAKAGAANTFTVNLKFDIPKDKITVNDRSINLTLNLKPKTATGIYLRPYVVKVTNIAIPEQVTATDLIIADTPSLSAFLKDDYKLQSGTTIGELRNKLSKEDFGNELVKIISELKIRYEPGKGYFAKPDYINLNEFTKAKQQ